MEIWGRRNAIMCNLHHKKITNILDTVAAFCLLVAEAEIHGIKDDI
jgi:hypothetical protein